MDPLLLASDLHFKLRGIKVARALGSPRASTGTGLTLQRQPSTDLNAQNQFKQIAKEHDLLAMLELAEQEFGWAPDAEVRERASATKRELELKVDEARENHGQVEIVEAQLAICSHAIRTAQADRVDALFREVDLTSQSSGKRIDAFLERARFGLAWGNYPFARTALEESAKLLTLGGDWDRRNRLRVYAGLFSMCSRDFAKASLEFLSGVATFTAEELFGYDRFVMYTMLTSVVALDRVQLKDKIISSPEIIAVLDSCYQTKASSYVQLSPLEQEAKEKCATVGRLVDALYTCQYEEFMHKLLGVHALLQQDRYLERHVDWFLREMRAKAYEQFLASYKSVHLSHMASAFGVSVPFMDHELARFIASKRLSAKIDKVAGVVETNRPDLVNQKYQTVIAQGDLLLTRVQKLARAVNV